MDEEKMTNVEEERATPITDISDLSELLNVEISRRKDIFYNVRDFGAKGDGVADDTEAIKSALAYLDWLGMEAEFHFISLYFPTGVYCCHEIDWNNQISMIGAEVASTVLRYNGKGVSGSYIIKATQWSSCSFAGFYNLSFDGYNSKDNRICEILYKDVESQGTDWGFKIENCYFFNCYGDAIHFNNGAIVNIHMDRVRFDAVGGFCFSFYGKDDMENRPVSITRITYDNSFAGTFEQDARKLGYYDGTHWGKGVVYAKDCRGGNFYISSARIELNMGLIAHNGRRAMFHLETSNVGSLSVLNLNQIIGYFRPEDGADVIYDRYGTAVIRTENVNIMGSRKLYYSSNSRYTPIKTNAMLGVTYSNVQQNMGFELNTKNIEVRNSKPDGSIYSQYKAGDIVLLSNPVIGGILGYQVTAPKAGYACPAGQTITTNAVVSAGNSEIKIQNKQAMEHIGEMAAIVIGGAGAAGADLQTYIESVDVVNAKFTVHDKPQKNVKEAVIKFQKPAFTEFGYLGKPNYAEKVDSLPAADMTQRGRIVRTEGKSGTADKVFICKKQANDTYAWVEL